MSYYFLLKFDFRGCCFSFHPTLFSLLFALASRLVHLAGGQRRGVVFLLLPERPQLTSAGVASSETHAGRFHLVLL